MALVKTRLAYPVSGSLSVFGWCPAASVGDLRERERISARDPLSAQIAHEFARAHAHAHAARDPRAGLAGGPELLDRLYLPAERP
jgi:hypothetical protein